MKIKCKFGKVKWYQHPILWLAYWRIRVTSKERYPNNPEVWDCNHIELDIGAGIIFHFAPPVATFKLDDGMAGGSIYLEADQEYDFYGLLTLCIPFCGSWYDVGELISIEIGEGKGWWRSIPVLRNVIYWIGRQIGMGSNNRVCSTGVAHILNVYDRSLERTPLFDMSSGLEIIPADFLINSKMHQIR